MEASQYLIVWCWKKCPMLAPPNRARSDMPFAKKFRAMMDFPFPGDTVGDFVVESVDVRDERGGSEGYVYGVRMVLQGPGASKACAVT